MMKSSCPLSLSAPETVWPTWIIPVTRPKPLHDVSAGAGRVPFTSVSRKLPSSDRQVEFA